MYRCKYDSWDSLFWEVVLDADYATTGRAKICPRADVPADVANARYKVTPPRHAAYVLNNLAVWEFVGILFRAKAAAKLYQWPDDADRVLAVVFAAEALMDAMDREPGLVDELGPIALHLLKTDVKTVDDLVTSLAVLGPQASDCVLRACFSYEDYWCAEQGEIGRAEVSELVAALS